MNVAIIGGGAAGFFAAITLKEQNKDIHVTIFEKTSNVLSKLAISGGGRCNLTNTFEEIQDLKKAYPRGDKLLKKAFRTFSHLDTVTWFQKRGVPLVTQEDQCVFPRSQNAQSIIDCFLHLSATLGVNIKRSYGLKFLQSKSNQIELHFLDEKQAPLWFDKVIVTTGGSPHREGLSYLEALGHKIEEPVPSLFTFNIPNDSIRELMGVVVENTIVSLQGTKLKTTGALLITHWGMSGPAILKLSSYAARVLKEKDYCATLLVNWVNEMNSDAILTYLNTIVALNPQKQVSNIRPYDLSSRLWTLLLHRAEIPENRRWNELGKKGVNRLMNVLSNDLYAVNGKGVFRDEFVTCGGVSLESVQVLTLESKVCPNLYFAGEVLDIDAITGGFNFQAAWTTAYLAAQAIARSSSFFKE